MGAQSCPESPNWRPCAQATNLDVYATIARPLVAPALSGISGTVFAYGVTSSGKTHTMLGGYVEGVGAEPGAWGRGQAHAWQGRAAGQAALTR